MTKTFRRRDLKEPTRDGQCWRGCDGSYCPWCVANRTNKKNKELTRAKAILNEL